MNERPLISQRVRRPRRDRRCPVCDAPPYAGHRAECIWQPFPASELADLRLQSPSDEPAVVGTAADGSRIAYRAWDAGRVQLRPEETCLLEPDARNVAPAGDNGRSCHGDSAERGHAGLAPHPLTVEG